MSRIGHNFQTGEPPIPDDVQPGPGWTALMLEMADHIGPLRTLLLVERFGGQRIYIPADVERGKSYEGRGTIRDLIGLEAARTLSHVYRREYLSIPTAKHALRRARRQGLVAAARAGDIEVSEAARIVGTTRPYMSHLVNQTDEGTEGEDISRRSGRIPGQLSMFGDEDDA